MTDLSSMPDPVAAVQRLAQFYQQLAPSDLDRLGDYYAADAFFKDPFNAVRGVPAITAIFVHMFAALQEPRFVITRTLARDRSAALEWEFHFRFQRWRPQVAQCIRGVSWLSLDAQGRVSHHRDYWDTAEEVYEKLPALGVLMRWLRRSGSAPAANAGGPPSGA